MERADRTKTILQLFIVSEKKMRQCANDVISSYCKADLRLNYLIECTSRKIYIMIVLQVRISRRTFLIWI